MGVQGFCGSVPVPVPDGAENSAALADRARVFGEVAEELEFLDRRAVSPPVQEPPPRPLVNTQGTDAGGAARGGLAVPGALIRAACHSPDPGDEFPHPEGLDEIVV